LLGGSLIIAIGAQNAFILRQGLLRAACVHPVPDLRAVRCAADRRSAWRGFGALISRLDTAIRSVTLGGAAFLTVYGLIALRRAIWPSGAAAAKSDGAGSLKAAVLTCLAFTFLNPHVYLDTVVLVGGLSGRLTRAPRGWPSRIGAMSASFLWFFGLGYGARLLEPMLPNRRPGVCSTD
jgi:L-lysine exporter family protein LysE/ArgO